MTTARKVPAPKFYDVPAGTRPSECRGQSCRAPIFWIETDEKKRIPVDCDVDGGYEPTDRDTGSGVSRFTTCPDVRQFSRSTRT